MPRRLRRPISVPRAGVATRPGPWVRLPSAVANSTASTQYYYALFDNNGTARLASHDLQESYIDPRSQVIFSPMKEYTYVVVNNAGKQIVASLARQLQQEYGNNFSEKNLRRMMQFAVRFPDKEKVVSLIRQLTWTHVIALIPIEDDLKRDCKRQ